MRRSRSATRQRTTPLVSSVAQAAGSVHGAELHDVVTALARIARASIFKSGVVASEEWRTAVDAVAARHLKRAAADRQLTRAIRRVSDPAIRDAVEVAHAQVLDVSELAHYYAGLMAGLAMLEWGRDRR